MESSLRLAVLLLLVTAAVTAEDLNHEAAGQRAKRWSGLSVFDSLRGKEGSTQPAPTKAPAGGDGVGFNLEDALQPGCQGGLLEKLNAVIENQNQQLRLLKQLTPSSRFYDRRTR
ncbi:uncharacterized protein LOC144389454 isoform X2 [Gasterosteus aculeatus]